MSYYWLWGTVLKWLVFIYPPWIQPRPSPGVVWPAWAPEWLQMQICQNFWPSSLPPRKVAACSQAWRGMLKRSSAAPFPLDLHTHSSTHGWASRMDWERFQLALNNGWAPPPLTLCSQGKTPIPLAHFQSSLGPISSGLPLDLPSTITLPTP